MYLISKQFFSSLSLSLKSKVRSPKSDSWVPIPKFLTKSVFHTHWLSTYKQESADRPKNYQH